MVNAYVMNVPGLVYVNLKNTNEGFQIANQSFIVGNLSYPRQAIRTPI
uniref:Uncharacterized protein n=1 Tax=Rhizophora mucronata TaxID=61149 RepID=A0A2P2QM92_RHIMU